MMLKMKLAYASVKFSLSDMTILIVSTICFIIICVSIYYKKLKVLSIIFGLTILLDIFSHLMAYWTAEENEKNEVLMWSSISLITIGITIFFVLSSIYILFVLTKKLYLISKKKDEPFSEN